MPHFKIKVHVCMGMMVSDGKSQGQKVGGGRGEPQHRAELQLEDGLCIHLCHHMGSSGNSVIFHVLLPDQQMTCRQES